MEHEAASGAALTIALATAAGIVSQSIARSVGIPGIVILLLVGVCLGPDGAGIIAPRMLGAALPQLVSFAVAVILFEGGMHLKMRHFRRRSTAIRRLITWGALITMAGATVAAHYVLKWEWRTAALFGSLVIVTGPTVVTPLVRRFRLIQPVRTVLEAEGILIDSIGAVIAIVALEVALEPSGANLVLGVAGIATRLGFGVLAGLLGGALIWGVLRYRGLVAEGLENVFSLAMVWALMQTSEAVMHESGIAAVTVAGLVVGNMKTARHRELLEFNDQLTVMLIGMLFVLLAADVRIQDVLNLGWPGVFTVVILVLLVRPSSVFLCLSGSTLRWPARVFIAWIGPRGIIAAAVSSLFATALDHAGLPGGAQVKAMVFLVIVVTVVLAGLTGGFVAERLGVRAKERGWLLLGAGEVSCVLARHLEAAGIEATCVDSSADACMFAERRGVEAILGNGIEEEVLRGADINLREGVAALTPNDEVNLLFVRGARRHGKGKRMLAALRTADWGATSDTIRQEGGQVLFGRAHDVALWSGRIRAGEAVLQRFVAQKGATLEEPKTPREETLPIVRKRGDQVTPVADDLTYRKDDELVALLSAEHQAIGRDALAEQGWFPLADPELPLPELASPHAKPSFGGMANSG